MSRAMHGNKNCINKWRCSPESVQRMMSRSTKARLMTWLVRGWCHVASYAIQHAINLHPSDPIAKSWNALFEHASRAVVVFLGS